LRLERAARLYRVLLGLAPQSLRERHGDEMAALFLEALASAHAAGRAAVPFTWMAATWDLIQARARHALRPRASLPPVPRERQVLMLGTDLRYTVRWLARQKFSTSLVIAMLSLGIAANVVVFSLVNGLFLRPFPFPEPERLVYINETAPKWNLEVVGINYPDFHQWRQGARLFVGLALFDTVSFNLSDGSGAERIDGATVTYDFPAVLRVEPLIGRLFTREEDKPRAQPVVVIGEALWRERFGGRDDVLQRTLKLNGVAHTIIGVVPKRAEFPGDVRLWVPFAGDASQSYQSYGAAGVGRLKPGVSAADGEKDLLRAHQPIWDERDKDRIVSPFTRPLREEFVRDYRTQASTLLVAVAILLLVACANVASVMLARAIARRQEMGIRLAVGACRTRLARQLFVENIVLAAIGGALGLAIGHWALRLLIASAGDQIPPWASFDLDIRVIGFSVTVSLATSILFGWAPALHAVRGNIRGAMHDVTKGTTAGPGGRRTLSLLVGAEFALAAVLLICGALLLRAYDRVHKVDSGFRADHVLTFTVALPDSSYPDDSKRLAFWDRLTDTVAAIPGVEAAGLVSCPPLGCHWGTFYVIEGQAPLPPGQSNPVTLYRPASPGYFRAMGIRLKSGRFFETADGRTGGRVVIVNETFAKTFWPGVTDPVGRRIRGTGEKSPWMAVVGLVEDVKHYGLERPMRPGIYVPVAQTPSPTLAVALRTAGDPAAVAATARAAIRAIDPDLALYRVRTMDEALRRSLAERRLYSWLLGVFAVMALVLALGGSYGVTSYLVSQRTREIGIRVALGARSADIVRSVLRGSLTAVGAGVLLGIGASIAAARWLADLLFGVPPADVAILTSAGLVLLLTAVFANWLPARRASRVDPMRSLRVE
jgi:predicted permease